MAVKFDNFKEAEIAQSKGEPLSVSLEKNRHEKIVKNAAETCWLAAGSSVK